MLTRMEPLLVRVTVIVSGVKLPAASMALTVITFSPE